MIRFPVRHFVILVTLSCCSATADGLPGGRVLLIGIDGCRPDALEAARTPHVDALIRNGCWTKNTRILGERYQKNDTISGPAWSSFLTGVWADKHGVHDNSFDGHQLEKFPHLFRRVKEKWPDARLGSFVDWEPIDRFIVQAADTRVVFPAKGALLYAQFDKVLARSAVEFLARPDSCAAMVYFGPPDENGHSHGFHPDVPQYIAAIERTDEHIGELIAAIKARPAYAQEDWLVIVSTDHGGKDKGHGDGHSEAEIYGTFLVVSGPSAQRLPISEQTYVVDVAVTALTHLSVSVRPEWNLDGRAVGLKTE